MADIETIISHVTAHVAVLSYRVTFDRTAGVSRMVSLTVDTPNGVRHVCGTFNAGSLFGVIMDAPRGRTVTLHGPDGIPPASPERQQWFVDAVRKS